MKCLTLKEKVFSMNIIKSLGLPQYYGNSFYGKSRYGMSFEYGGIYQNRYEKKYPNRGRQIVKMKFYHPINPKTELQVIRQNKFAEAIKSYQTLINQGYFDRIKSILRHAKTVYHGYISLFMKDDPEVLSLLNEINYYD